MNTKAKEIFLAFIGIVVLVLYIAKIYGWVDFAQWISISSDFISYHYTIVKDYLPSLYIGMAAIVIVKMMFISYQMGKTKIILPRHTPGQLLLPASNDMAQVHSPASYSPLTTEMVTAERNDNAHHLIRERHQSEMARHKKEIEECVIAYVVQTMAPYMKSNDLTVLCENIKSWATSKDIALTPTLTSGQLSTLDLRHLAWNIGDRFKWSGEQRAVFIKQSFPHEFRDLEIKSIKQNLRQHGNCIIHIDIPEKHDYKFHSNDEKSI